MMAGVMVELDGCVGLRSAPIISHHETRDGDDDIVKQNGFRSGSW